MEEVLVPYQMNEAEAKLEAALRSGRYPQGYNKLKSRGPASRFCCLGVGCTESEMAIWETDNPEDPDFDPDAGDRYMNQEGTLPLAVARWLGWKYRSGTTIIQDRNGHTLNLIECNDGLKLTFNQIADIIRAGLMLHGECEEDSNSNVAPPPIDASEEPVPPNAELEA